jgi:GMP synthase-like glutamine amidotransferase
VILYIITETAARYAANTYAQHKGVFERAAGDLCLVLHYTQFRRDLLARLRPWAVCHSGNATPFADYGILRDRGYRDAVRNAPIAQLGICGGHQIIAAFFGGRVAPMHPLAADEADANPRYHAGSFKEWGVFPVRLVRRDPLFAGLGAAIRVQEFHRDEVREIGPDLVPLAESAACRVQAFKHRRQPIYGVQFHPEESSSDYPDGFRILRNFFRIARHSRRPAV